MQRWEYLHVHVYGRDVVEVNGQEVAKVKRSKSWNMIEQVIQAETIWQFLNRVGSDGWELVSVVIDNEPVTFTNYVLKRPLMFAPDNIQPPQA